MNSISGFIAAARSSARLCAVCRSGATLSCGKLGRRYQTPLVGGNEATVSSLYRFQRMPRQRTGHQSTSRGSRSTPKGDWNSISEVANELKEGGATRFRSCPPWLAAVGIAFAWQGVLRADNETRRAVGSRSVDEVFDLTGLNIVMGQSDGVATAHTDVTNAAWYTMRGTDAPAADGGNSLHGLEVAAIMIGRDATEAEMRRRPRCTLIILATTVSRPAEAAARAKTTFSTHCVT